jgi:hypothetical protein
LDSNGFATWAKVEPYLNPPNTSHPYVTFSPSTPGDSHRPPTQPLYTKLNSASADQDVVKQLAAGHPVVIHGTQNAMPSPPDFGHTMFATGVVIDPSHPKKVIGIMANDPELGQQVIIGWDPSNITYHHALVPNPSDPAHPMNTYKNLSFFDFEAISYFYVIIN